MFPSVAIAGSGLTADQTWLDTIGGNVANANDVGNPGAVVYREQSVMAQPVSSPSGAGAGVEVVGVALSSAPGNLISDPTSPLANAKGLVMTPNVSIGHEMVSLVEAQSNYEADATVLQNADTAYKSILAIKA